MFCMNCGKKLPDHAKFCFYCGEKVDMAGIRPDPAPKIPGPQIPGPQVPGPQIPGPQVPGSQMPGPRAGTPQTKGQGTQAGTPQMKGPGTREMQTGTTQTGGQGTQAGTPQIPGIIATGFGGRTGNGNDRPYIPPIMPKPVTESTGKVVFRVGHSRNVSRILHVGVELAGIGIVTLLLRVILLTFISWRRSVTNSDYNSLGDDKSQIFTILLAFIFLLAVCVVSEKKNDRLWLGFFPPALIIADCIVELIKTNDSYSQDYYGYNVGWSVYKGQILIFGIYLVVYLLLFLQRKSESRWGAWILFFYAMIAMCILLWKTADQAFVAAAIRDTKVVWYHLLSGLSTICFHIPFVTIALREMLAAKGDTPGHA